MDISDFFFYFIQIVLPFISFVAVLCLLLKSRPLKNSPMPEDRMFRKMCILVMIYSVFVLIRQLLLFVPDPPGPFGNVLIVITAISYYVPDFLYVFFALMWLCFVDMSLFHIRERVIKRIRSSVIPLSSVIVFQILLIVLCVIILHRNSKFDDITTLLDHIYYIFMIVIGLIFIIKGYRALKFYYKNRKEPLFLRLDIFIIPWLIGFFLKAISPILLMINEIANIGDIKELFEDLGYIYLGTDPFFAALALFLTYYSMRLRYRFMDYETGFYSEDFIDFMKKYAIKHNYRKGSLISFKSSMDIKDNVSLLNDCKPERCMIFRLKDDSFLILTSQDNKIAVETLISMIKDEGRMRDPEADISLDYRLIQEDDSDRSPLVTIAPLLPGKR